MIEIFCKNVTFCLNGKFLKLEGEMWGKERRAKDMLVIAANILV